MEASSINKVAPFVWKTYQMVDDPSTNIVIKWGRENNTFIVTDPCSLSQNLLPVYFKHNNFSSFIRQLNTYGFKKVDPDIWEFANEAFLRGQIQLLENIVRRRYSRYTYNAMQPKQEFESQFDEKELSIEVKRLRQEDKVLGDEIEMMGKRLEAAERRPQQMMAFLLRKVQEPETLSRMMTDNKEEEVVLRKKKRHILSTQNVPQALALPAVPFTDSFADQSRQMVFYEDCGASITQATSSSFPFSLLG